MLELGGGAVGRADNETTHRRFNRALVNRRAVACDCQQLADSGFTRISAAGQSSMNDRSPAVRLAKRLAAVDPADLYWLRLQASTCFETKSSMPDGSLRFGLGPTDVHDELHDQVGEVEAPVESVGERAEVAVCVFARVCNTRMPCWRLTLSS